MESESGVNINGMVAKGWLRHKENYVKTLLCSLVACSKNVDILG